jgi:hypothetical protein
MVSHRHAPRWQARFGSAAAGLRQRVSTVERRAGSLHRQNLQCRWLPLTHRGRKAPQGVDGRADGGERVSAEEDVRQLPRCIAIASGTRSAGMHLKVLAPCDGPHRAGRLTGRLAQRCTAARDHQTTRRLPIVGQGQMGQTRWASTDTIRKSTALAWHGHDTIVLVPT